MALSTLQVAALIAGSGLTAAGMAGAVGFFAMSEGGQGGRSKGSQIELVIPTRSDCINDGLREAQAKNFSRQVAYDIEVRCEQLIQSLEGRKAAKR
ncbi:hypothetical protein [Ferrovibrio sp.]|uniref:hypothetical protein n=1 Tax=Ferrovibrio sp. TaxID=1917215 RepID=UPI0025BB39D9|nr:hypothetical protein [Ferrovibrio sp.]MBX3456165.1 hypothetical protein [Ferrovibrio sp.]